MSPVSALETEVRALERMDLEGLREAWRRRWGSPPKLRSPDLVRALMAWRIQAAALGGLDVDLRRSLRSAPAKIRGPALQPGMRIAREWKGARHEVEVVEGGYAYAGAVHASLSGVAREITGVRWNGPRFFGLREEAP
jgi:hypothetical protein